MRHLDTDVLIDIGRGYLPAIQWYASVVGTVSVSGIVVMELVAGCVNKVDLSRVQSLVAPLTIIWLAEGDGNRALADFTQFYLSHNLGLLDALIASTAVGKGAALCTFNAKHFAAVPNLIMEQPYQRP